MRWMTKPVLALLISLTATQAKADLRMEELVGEWVGTVTATIDGKVCDQAQARWVVSKDTAPDGSLSLKVVPEYKCLESADLQIPSRVILGKIQGTELRGIIRGFGMHTDFHAGTVNHEERSIQTNIDKSIPQIGLQMVLKAEVRVTTPDTIEFSSTFKLLSKEVSLTDGRLTRVKK